MIKKLIIIRYKLKCLIGLYRIINVKKEKRCLNGPAYVAVFPLESDGDIIAYKPGCEFLSLIVPPEFIQGNRRAKMLEESMARLYKGL